MSPLALLFLMASQNFNLPPGVLSAVCFVESAHRPNVVNVDDGNADSIGLCQIQLPTARLLGYTGSAAKLKDPAVNAYWAAAYLHRNLIRYHGDTLRAICAYNSGSYRTNADGLPVNRAYLQKVLLALKEGR